MKIKAIGPKYIVPQFGSISIFSQLGRLLFEIHKFSIIDIFVLLKLESKLEIVVSDISFNSLYSWEIINLYRNAFSAQLFPIYLYLK